MIRFCRYIFVISRQNSWEVDLELNPGGSYHPLKILEFLGKIVQNDGTYLNITKCNERIPSYTSI